MAATTPPCDIRPDNAPTATHPTEASSASAEPEDADCKYAPWNATNATLACLRQVAPWSFGPRELLSLVDDYLENEWIVLLASGQVVASGRVVPLRAYATTPLEYWHSFPIDVNVYEAKADVYEIVDTTGRSDDYESAPATPDVQLNEPSDSGSGGNGGGIWRRLKDTPLKRYTNFPIGRMTAAGCVDGRLLISDDAFHFDALSLTTGLWHENVASGGPAPASFLGTVVHLSKTALSPQGGGEEEEVDSVCHGCIDYAVICGGQHPLLARAAPFIVSADTIVAFKRLPPLPVGGRSVMCCLRNSSMGKGQGQGLLVSLLYFRSASYAHWTFDGETWNVAAAPDSAEGFHRVASLQTGEMAAFRGMSGVDGNAESTTEIYSPATNSWRRARWALPNTGEYVRDLLVANELLYVLYRSSLYVARLDSIDAGAPCEWREMALPAGVHGERLAHIPPHSEWARGGAPGRARGPLPCSRDVPSLGS